jgi:hypothetical protein
MPKPSQPLAHDQHDALLVAALAAGDLAGTDRDHARNLVAICRDCAQLHDDLVAIARATAAVPAPAVLPARDFRLTPADAARLRPGGWRRFLAAFAGARAATKPLGVALTTIGLAGLLVTSVPFGFASGGAATRLAPVGAGVESGGAGRSSYEAAQPPASLRGLTTDAGAPSAAASTIPTSSAAVGFGDNASPQVVSGGPKASSAPGAALGPIVPSGGVPVASNAAKAGNDGTPAEPEATGGSASDGSGVYVTESSAPPIQVWFGLAILAGLGLLVLGRVASRVARI